MKKYFLSLFFLLYSFSLFSQNKYTISGYVQEAASGENLIGVSIYNKASQKGTTSNQYGFYSITLEEGSYTIIYSFIGLNTSTKKITLNKLYLQIVDY